MNRFRRWLLKLVMFEVGVVKIEPVDIVVFRTPEHINMTILQDIHEELTGVFPNNRVLILYGGAEIETVKGVGSNGVAPEEGTYSIDYIDHRTVRLRKVAI